MTAAYSLRKHSDYQRVYRGSRKRHAKHLSYFFLLRNEVEDQIPDFGPRVGLTVGKVMGKAVDRNRIKRRMREAVRSKLALLSLPVDVILHPRRDVLSLQFAALQGDVEFVFQAVQGACQPGSGRGRQKPGSKTE